MSDKVIFQKHAEVCKAMAHGLRIEVIDLLGDKELGFSELVKKTGATKSNLSQHLSVMVEKGILVQRKVGLNSYFKLSTPKVAQACSLMREVLIEQLKKTNEILKEIE